MNFNGQGNLENAWWKNYAGYRKSAVVRKETRRALQAVELQDRTAQVCEVSILSLSISIDRREF